MYGDVSASTMRVSADRTKSAMSGVSATNSFVRSRPSASSVRNVHRSTTAGQADEREDELDSLIAETLAVQESTVSTTERALARVQQVEDVAQASLQQLNAQGEQLQNIDGNLNNVGNAADQATASTNYLDKLMRPFFVPVLGKQPDLTSGSGSGGKPTSGQGNAAKKTWGSRSSSLAHAKKHGNATTTTSINATSVLTDAASDQQHAQSQSHETAIDSNLTQISSAVLNLRNIAVTMNSEVDRQNQLVGRISDKVDEQNDKVNKLTNKLEKIGRKI